MESANKTVCHQEAQEELSNPAALIEETVQQETVQQDKLQQETVQQEKLQQEAVQQDKLQQETVQQETVQQETVQQEKLQQETVQQEKLQQETVQQEKLQQETVQQEKLQWETVQQEKLQWETVQQEKLQQETVQQEKLQWETVQQEKLQWETVQQEKLQWETVQQEKLQWETVQQETVQQETEQVSFVPPTSTNKAASRKKNLDDIEEEFSPLDFLKEFRLDLEQFASEPSISDLALSPKQSKLSDYQPPTSQSVADFSCVPPTTTNNNTVSRKRKLDDTEKEVPLPPPSYRDLLDFLKEFRQDRKQVASVPSTSDLAASPKKTNLSNYQPSESQNVEDTSKDLDPFKSVDGEELSAFLKQFKQEMGGIDSEPSESDMCLKVKRTNVSDNRLSNRKSTAGLSHVPSTATSKRKLEVNKPYIKKPPNAFMLFRAEQRQRVVYELGINNCARVNAELGRRWKMLSEEEQERYFEMALREKRAHQTRYPNWSAKDNFGKKVRHKYTPAPKSHHFGFPTNQQPWPYATGPTSFPPQASYHQGPYYPTWGPSQHPFYQPGGPTPGAFRGYSF